MKYIYLPVLALLLLLGACKTGQKNGKKTNKMDDKLELIGTAWQALHASDTTGKGTVLHYSKPFVLQFSDTTRLQLRLDANNCRAGYAYAGGLLTLDPNFSCTKKCCDAKDGLELRDMLAGKAWRARLDDNKNLVLRSDANIEILFKPVPASE